MSDFPTIPGYTIERLLGRGGMGAVYLARQDSLNRRVALKVTLATLGELDETFARRFVREARTTASLRHPNIITVYESGEVDGRCFMSMEYIEGGSLSQLLEIRRLSVDEVIDIGKGVCAALARAHRAGFIHRDIKPENIMLDGDGRPVVTDFGIVKSIHSSTNLTGTNATVGSPQYMSPEQLLGDARIDGRADLYSLGVVIFEMLEGRPPFDDEQDYAVGMKHLTGAVPPLSPLHDRFQPLIDKLLQKNPDQRFQEADAVARALEGLRSHSVPPAMSRRPAVRHTPSSMPISQRPPKASLSRRLGSRFNLGRWLFWGTLGAAVLVWAVWLEDFDIKAVQYEARGFFGSAMDRFLVGQALFERGDVDRARFWLTRAMDAGFPGAAYELGRSYRYQDEGMAVRYLERELDNDTRDSNDGNAAHLIGFLLCNGSGVEDCGEAIRRLRPLAEQGDADAMLRIGEIHYARTQPPDYGQALIWLEKAAAVERSKASIQAMELLARLHDEGLGVPRDRRAATDWLVQAALRPQASDAVRQRARSRCSEQALRSAACQRLGGGR